MSFTDLLLLAILIVLIVNTVFVAKAKRSYRKRESENAGLSAGLKPPPLGAWQAFCQQEGWGFAFFQWAFVVFFFDSVNASTLDAFALAFRDAWAALDFSSLLT